MSIDGGTHWGPGGSCCRGWFFCKYILYLFVGIRNIFNLQRKKSFTFTYIIPTDILTGKGLFSGYLFARIKRNWKLNWIRSPLGLLFLFCLIISVGDRKLYNSNCTNPFVLQSNPSIFHFPILYSATGTNLVWIRGWFIAFCRYCRRISNIQINEGA